MEKKNYGKLRLKKILRKLTDNFVVIINLQIVDLVTCTKLVQRFVSLKRAKILRGEREDLSDSRS